ncbi:MAG: hypothetical protein IRZ03_16205 [Acidobacterium ailaaui]|nr:hypothetical protein [Pseudacidobacterium ailaaui]
MTLEQALQQGKGIAWQQRGAAEFFVFPRSARLVGLAIRSGGKDFSMSLPVGELASALARWRLRQDRWQPVPVGRRERGGQA